MMPTRTSYLGSLVIRDQMSNRGFQFFVKTARVVGIWQIEDKNQEAEFDRTRWQQADVTVEKCSTETLSFAAHKSTISSTPL